jgi:hypothetical protein
MQPMWCKKNIIENVPKGDPVIVRKELTKLIVGPDKLVAIINISFYICNT